MHDHVTNNSGPENWLPILLFLLLMSLYSTGVYNERKAGKKWSNFRTGCFLSGIVIGIIAVAPPLSQYGHHDLRGHMIQHLLIGMLAPLGLVLGAPLTLLLRRLPAEKGRRISSILGSRPFHTISHPVTALLLNIGGMYILYLTPLYATMQENIWLHHIVHIHFFAAGYLFIWSVAGPDPSPDRPSLRLRLLVLFVSMATHAFLGKFMYAYGFPRNTSHRVVEIQEAAKIMYYGGDFAEVLLAVAFFSVWYRSRERKIPAVKIAE